MTEFLESLRQKLMGANHSRIEELVELIHLNAPSLGAQEFDYAIQEIAAARLQLKKIHVVVKVIGRTVQAVHTDRPGTVEVKVFYQDRVPESELTTRIYTELVKDMTEVY